MALNQETLVNLTAEIAPAHVSNNAIPVSDLASMIESIFAALQALSAPVADPVPEKRHFPCGRHLKKVVPLR